MTEKAAATATAPAPAPQVKYAGPVHVTIPASVAFNMEKMQKVLVSIGERVGCSPCLSGADCFFKIERDWLVDPASLALRSAVELER